ncbi:MAG: dienelactone hydrolase family protein [Leptospira sp.]|nr:dienelactone hydrolase family protein [Leptospira sp.]
MKNFLILVSAFAIFSCTSTPSVELPIKSTVVGNAVEYKLDGKTYEGYMAVDKSLTGKRPGVLVIHEWWGLNDYPKQRAKQLADLGYVAFALDLYGKGIVANNHEEAGKLSNANGDSKILLKKINEALKILKSNPDVDPSNIAAIGYCFGGKAVIELALDGQVLKGGIVSFHGMLGSNNLATGAKKVKTKMLIHHGADDPFMSKEVVSTFVKTLEEAKAPFTFVAYPGAQHGFSKPSADSYGIKGLSYNKKADYASFESMKSFLAENFK